MSKLSPEPLVERLRKQLYALNWQDPVPDDLQSEVRMLFNEALAGGPNMNGDGGPGLSVNHALDCLSAAEEIERLRTQATPSPELERVEQIISAWAFAHNIDGAARNDLFARLRSTALSAISASSGD